MARMTFPTTAADLDDRWMAAPDVTARDVPGGMILVSLRSGRCVQINATGADFWRALNKLQSLPDAIDEVAREYGPLRDLVAADLRRFVTALSSEGALVRPPTER